ncbi:winged helix-turn-helix domain-containing protein [Paraglaciecola sp. MB-3u-78]|uniref:nSTAND1 domain-containing NTPase n=1 Tax=Paraglaciecola sp. MB-3u-78 TaxID=2058332 RepID=UPI000C33CF1C|nr:winged helix-turn-helix domain-containing protein [Paraglaciecola sp. MB-3u-78]PKG99952.1 transcriptional regulator [Paraglaciecola sp. MB-3u-78]
MLKDSSLFFLGNWQVNPSTNTLRRGELIKQLEPKAMDVLLLLCKQQGDVLSADAIATQCWGGMDIGDNPVHKAITQLRKALDDKPSTPTYIETIRKRGYHIIAKLDFPLDDEFKAEQNSWQGASPFPGLVAFEAKDAQVFFGRNTQIATLLEQLANQVSDKHTFCLILGPSGTGKSSLVNAGLLPALTGPNGYNGIGVVSDTSIDFADVIPERLFIDLASAMLDWDVNDQPVFAGMSAESLAQQLQGDSNTSIEQCIQSLKQTHKSYSKPQFLLFIDRLEVLLSSAVFSNDTRGAFLDLIQKLATSGAIMVLSACRNDFYPLVVNHPSLMANKGNGGHFDLLAPTRAELMQMIRLPAKAANLTWSVDADSATPLDQLLCAEAANNPDALPMLQYTLQELYLQRSESDELQVSVYKALGGIEGAIGKKAEEIYQQLPEEHQPQLAAVLSHLVTLNPDGETITSRTARWSELSQASDTSFVQAMVNSRLFVSHLQNNEPCFSLAHEALLRRWPRASEWISVHKDSLTIKSRLQQLTERWLKEDKSSAYLLPQGKPLEEALSLQNMPVFTLDADEQALLNASQQKVKTKRWLTRSTISLLCLLTFTAIFMSVKSQQSEAFAQQKRLDAESLLGFMVGEFADKLRSVKRMDLLDGISNKALEYFSQQEDDDNGLFFLSDPALNFKARFQHAQTLGAMGEVAYSRAKTDEAKQAFVTAKVILDKLYVEQADNLELLKTLGANAFWLGQLKYDESDFDGAQPLFELYRDYSRKMNRLEPENIDGHIELYNALSTLGSLYLQQLRYNEAKEAFQSSLNMTNQLLLTYPSDNLIHSDKADSLSWLATIEQHLGNLDNALLFQKKGQQAVEAVLSSEPDNATFLERLAYSYWLQAKIKNYLGAYSQAHEYISKAMVILQKLIEQDPHNEVWNGDLLGISISEILYAEKSGIHENDDFIYLIDPQSVLRPSTILEIIRYYQAKGNWKESAELIELSSVHLAFPPSNVIEPNDVLAYAQLKLLESYQHNYDNNIVSKIKACKQIIQLLAPLIVKSHNVEYLLPYVQAHSCIGKLSKVSVELEYLDNMGINLKIIINQIKEN